jgi:hypothetical protein
MCVIPDLIRVPVKKLRALLTHLIGFVSCLAGDHKEGAIRSTPLSHIRLNI